MKAALTDGKGKVWISELPLPVPGDYECLCRIDACATCTGTDKKLISGKMSWAKPENYPAALGHESVGTVIQVGKKVRNISPGERFLRPAAWYLGMVKDGITSFMGGFAEYGLVTDVEALAEDHPEITPPYYCRYQQRIPADVEISDADATMLVTMKEIYSFIRDVGIKSGDKVAVLGAGAVGMSMIFFAKLAGADVAVAARREEQLAMCRNIGVDHTVNIAEKDLRKSLLEWSGDGVGFILDAAGSSEMLIAASGALAYAGAVCAYAGGNGIVENFGKLDLPVSWKIISSPPQEDSAHEHLIALARDKKIPFHHFYTGVMPLEDIADGFEKIFAKKQGKMVFLMHTSV
ncbi:MAG: zinc-binding dehydrogenase [Lentisphaeria bacterium]|nr:zinc-binding dehydrogenase [Lentisphaeria bacterium]